MYEYEERKDRSSIKGVIVQILLMVMFIFILICLFPSKSDLDKLKATESISSLEPLYDRIFNNNIIAMKEAAKDYYTTPRLPKNVGDKVSMTLKEMLDKKIILPFTDKDGNSCDLEESYVSITKEDEEFRMKVNLKCKNQENYLLVVMGCYDYCETGICEKDESDIKSPTINSSKPSTIVKETIVRPIINNNITINNYCVSENCKPGKYYCQQIGNNFYGKDGNLVSKEIYEKECKIIVEKYYCKIIGDKYYGENGTVVDKATYEKECTVPEKYYCKIVGDKYYGKNGTVVDKTTYEKECTVPEKYYCKVVGDKYYGKNGNVVDKTTYENECIQYQCKYMKTTNSTFSAWSDWTDWSEKKDVPSNLKQERSKVVTLHKLEKQLVGYKTVTYKDPNKPVYANKQVLVGKRNETKCIEYGYIITATGAINTNVTYGPWTTAPDSPVPFYSTPKDTSTERYTAISVGTDTCGSCGAHMYTIYKKEVRTVSLTSAGASKNSVYQCLRTATREVPVYGTQRVIVDYDTSSKREAVYGLVTVERKVNMYSYRTRSVIGGTTDYKISNCNDQNLLNNGYQIIEKMEI